MTASDILSAGLIFRNTPKSWHPYIKLTRFDRPIGSWLLLFPCWWSIVLAGGGAVNMLKFAAGAVLMRSAGCIINDLWDRKLDASVARTRTRPLASGEISVRLALYFLAILLLFSLGILLTLAPLAVALGVLSLIPVALYPLMKRITWWPQLFLGFTFNWGALMGWAATTGSLSKEAFLLYAASIFWTLGYDTIYAHQDREDDALVGIKSTARLFGNNSRIYVAVFYALSLLLLILAKPQNILFAVPAALQLLWQLKTWDMNDPQSSLRIFKSNQVYGWLVLLMMGV